MWNVRMLEELHRNRCSDSKLKEISIIVDGATATPRDGSTPAVRPPFGIPGLRWGMLHGGAKLIGSERWTYDRCGKDVSYRVNYFRSQDGDEFFPIVVPATVGGWMDYSRWKWDVFRRSVV
jgi:hypothetical protein